MTKRVNEILHFVWDPIGVSGVPQARDEYDSYVPLITRLLIEKKGAGEIANHLREIELNSMGLNPTSKADDRRSEVAALLVDHYEWISQIH